MINTSKANWFCNEDISKIENYEQAKNDKSQTWDCHHRDEIRTLPSGMKVYRSKQELIENGRYYHCPANELIFLTHREHMRLHYQGKARSTEIGQKISESKKGKHHSTETRKKIGEATKCMTWKVINGKRVWLPKEIQEDF